MPGPTTHTSAPSWRPFCSYGSQVSLWFSFQNSDGSTEEANERLHGLGQVRGRTHGEEASKEAQLGDLDIAETALPWEAMPIDRKQPFLDEARRMTAVRYISESTTANGVKFN